MENVSGKLDYEVYSKNKKEFKENMRCTPSVLHSSTLLSTIMKLMYLRRGREEVGRLVGGNKEGETHRSHLKVVQWYIHLIWGSKKFRSGVVCISRFLFSSGSYKSFLLSACSKSIGRWHHSKKIRPQFFFSSGEGLPTTQVFIVKVQLFKMQNTVIENN